MRAPPPVDDALHKARDDGGTRSLTNEVARESALGHRRHGSRRIGWRLRILVGAALLGCLALIFLVSALSAVPASSAALQANDDGTVQLVTTAQTPHGVHDLVDRSGHFTAVDALLRNARHDG